MAASLYRRTSYIPRTSSSDRLSSESSDWHTKNMSALRNLYILEETSHSTQGLRRKAVLESEQNRLKFASGITLGFVVPKLHQLCAPHNPLNTLQMLRYRVLHDKRRDEVLIAMARGVFYNMQLVLFMILFIRMPSVMDLDFLFVCPEKGSLVFLLWVSFTATIAGAVRTFTNSSSWATQEVFYLSPQPPGIHPRKCKGCSVLIELPPTQIPYQHRKHALASRSMRLKG